MAQWEWAVEEITECPQYLVLAFGWASCLEQMARRGLALAEPRKGIGVS